MNSSDPLNHTPQTPAFLLDYTVWDLYSRYTYLPSWAVTAFFVLQQPQSLWTPEARALLNLAYVPPVRTQPPSDTDRFMDIHVKVEDMVAKVEGWEKAREDHDLWRLSRDLIKAKEDCWEQWKGKMHSLQ